MLKESLRMHSPSASFQERTRKSFSLTWSAAQRTFSSWNTERRSSLAVANPTHISLLECTRDNSYFPEHTVMGVLEYIKEKNLRFQQRASLLLYTGQWVSLLEYTILASSSCYTSPPAASRGLGGVALENKMVSRFYCKYSRITITSLL